MFKKWFNRFKSPNKSGSGSVQSLDSERFAKIYELELSNMEGAPSYTLTHQITIGSEIGNIVVADPSVSPRHATFVLQQEVISLIDHSSMAGTYINGKKINSGKYVILEETDVVACGDLEVRIKVRHEAFPEESETDSPPEEMPDYKPAMPAGDLQLDDIQSPQLTSKPQKETPPPAEKKVMTFKVQSTSNSTASPEAKKKKKFKLKLTSYHAANSLVRILAIIGDVLFSIVLIEVMWTFDSFRGFLEYVPSLFFELIGMDQETLWSLVTTDVPEIKPLVDEALVIANQIVPVGPLFMTFIIVRLISTFVLGVSISEFMVGMRAVGNGVWNRIGGVLRVLLGIITGPFLIFDLPSVMSRRTFKEFMTFTNTDAYSKMMTFVGSLIWFPLLAVLFLVSPMIRGLEIVEPIDVTTKIDKRVKVADQSPPPAGAEVAQPTSTPTVMDGSKYYGFDYTYNPLDVSVIPFFKFQGGNNKLKYQTGTTFYLKELQSPVNFQIYKTFDLKELLAMALRGNFLLFSKYPELYNYSHEVTDKSFLKGQTPESQERFANEFINFTKLSFGISADNIVETVQTQTFMIKGLVDFKEALIGLFEYKDFNKLDLVQIGNTIFFRANYLGNAPFDLIIPLTKGPGRIYKVSFGKRQGLKDSSNKYYKYIMEKSNWLSPIYPLPSDKMTAMEAAEFFGTLDVKQKKVDRNRALALYGYYYELSTDVLKRADMNEYGILKKSIEDVAEIFTKLLSGVRPPETAESDKQILKNFNDLKSAIDSRNFVFFGLEQNI